MRKVFLEDLPKWSNGTNKNRIKWDEVNGLKVKFVYDDLEGWLEILKYEAIIKSKRKRNFLTIKYNNIIKIIDADKLLQGKIGDIIGTKTKEFKVEIGTIFKDENRDMVITDREHRINNKSNGYIQNDKWYKYTCNKCGWTEGWIKEGNLTGHKQGCSVCCNTPRIVVIGYNSMWDTNRWMVALGVSEEDAKSHTYGSRDKLKVTCPDCGNVKSAIVCDIYRNHSIGCSCSDKLSYPSKVMFAVFKQLKIDVTAEYSPKWCRYIDYKNSEKIKIGRYDFLLNDTYIKDSQVLVEVDGGFHSRDNRMSGQTKEESKYIDDNKDKLALENGYEVIRIDCDKSELEFIKQNTLNSKLNELFDLSKIDWIEVEQLALKNKVKECCEYWDNGIKSIKEISKIMKLSDNTIRTYLKKGNDMWCNYDAKDELNKGRVLANIRSTKVTSKRVICLDNLLVFESAHDCARQCFEIFGVKMDNSSISDVSRGTQSHHKGFHFKYVQDLTSEERILYKLDIQEQSS